MFAYVAFVCIKCHQVYKLIVHVVNEVSAEPTHQVMLKKGSEVYSCISYKYIQEFLLWFDMFVNRTETFVVTVHFGT